MSTEAQAGTPATTEERAHLDEVKNTEPIEARTGGSDGMHVTTIKAHLPERLRPIYSLFMERVEAQVLQTISDEVCNLLNAMYQAAKEADDEDHSDGK